MKEAHLLSLLLVISCIAGCNASPERHSGRFVEARTASVFAGACHYGAEYTTGGRQAVLAWRFNEGPAVGADVVAVVSSDKNLAMGEADRRSAVYLNGPKGACDAALEVIEGRGILGEIVSIDEGARIAFNGDRYRVTAGNFVELSGALLPDRACCSMPSHVWYAPLASEAPGIVGNSDTFRCVVAALDVRFESSGENDAFVGSFLW